MTGRSPQLDSGPVHLRRALLLFAIVLGLAALIASVNRPRDQAEPSREPKARPPARERATPAASQPGTAKLSFRGGTRPRTRRLAAGRPATIVVRVDAVGQAELRGLGLVQPALPDTPARFELLTDEPGRYPVVFIPSSTDVKTRAGTLVVYAPDPRTAGARSPARSAP